MRTGAGADAFGLRLLYQPRIQRICLAALLGAVLLVRALQFFHFTSLTEWGFDLSFYWTAGQHVLAGESVYAPFQTAGPYPPQGVAYEYLYPPFLAVAVAPLVALFGDYRAANWLWAGLGATILALVVLTVAHRERLGSRVDRALLVGAAFALAPVTSELILGNVHLLILGLLAGAWLAVDHRTPRGDIAAGALVGVAALIKVFPGLIVVWFLLTGRVRAAVAAVATMVLLAVATLPVVGLKPWLEYPTVLQNLGPPTELSFVLAPMVWLAGSMPPLLAQGLVTVAGLAVVAWTTRRRSEPISFGVAVAVSVLAAPALYPHYLAIMVLPLLLALGHTRPAGWIVLVFVAVSGGDGAGLGGAAWIVTRGLPTLGALAVVLGLAWFGRGDSPVEPYRVRLTQATSGRSIGT
jgi:alpha-1,2-mannosyltransferase